MTAPSVSIIVPVYNSSMSIEPLVRELHVEMPALCREFEIILVNDGSRDDSWRIVERLAAELPAVRGLNLMRNYGQHNALLAGVRAARNEIVVTMDDDLEHPPQEVHHLLEKLAEGYDVVYGVPARQRHGVLRDLASYMTKVALQGAMGADNARNISAFRAFRTGLRGAFEGYSGPFVSIDVLLTWATTRFTYTVVRHAARRFGESNYTLRKLITHALNMVTGFSIVPLQLASITGFAFTIFGIGLFGYVSYNYFVLGGRVPGFTFLASVIAIFSGAQLFALGIIGEYLARVHFRLMDKPPYAIKERTGAAPSP